MIWVKPNMKSVTAFFTCAFAASVCLAASNCANAATFTTSFDCATATLTVEKLICRDAQLAQMDVELNRLYRLSLTDEHAVPLPDKVMIDQQFWVDERNQCASAADPRTCVIGAYAERAHRLRQGSAIVRTKDPDRLTEGPLAFRCQSLNALLAATFFSTRPAVVYLSWGKNSITLNQVPSDSGSRYVGKDSLGPYSFWQDGSSVLFQKPGAAAMSCTAEPIG